MQLHVRRAELVPGCAPAPAVCGSHSRPAHCGQVRARRRARPRRPRLPLRLHLLPLRIPDRVRRRHHALGSARRYPLHPLLIPSMFFNLLSVTFGTLHYDPYFHSQYQVFLIFRIGINIFLDGFVPTENLRFRETALVFKLAESAQAEVVKRTFKREYPALSKKLGFR